MYNDYMRKSEKAKMAEIAASENGEKKPEENVVDIKAVSKEYLDVVFYQIKQADGLLGDFGENDDYYIRDEKLINALTLAPKHFDVKEENVVFSSIKVGKYVLTFRAELDICESYCTASLKIVELEHRGEETIKHVQELAKFVEIYSPMFEENVLKEWNIVKTPVVLDKDNPIAKYLAELQGNEYFMKELSDLLAQTYLLKMLGLLESCGEEGIKVKKEYLDILAKLSAEDPSVLRDHIRLKKLMDSLILKHNALPAIINAGGSDILKGYIDPINNVLGKATSVPEKIKGSLDKSPEQPKAPKVELAKPKKSKSKSSSDGKGGDKGGDKGGSKKDGKKFISVSDTKKEEKKAEPVVKSSTIVSMGGTGESKEEETVVDESDWLMPKPKTKEVASEEGFAMDGVKSEEVASEEGFAMDGVTSDEKDEEKER